MTTYFLDDTFYYRYDNILLVICPESSARPASEVLLPAPYISYSVFHLSGLCVPPEWTLYST